MEARVNAEWKALYRFDVQEQLLPDYEVTSWYLSNHPASQFVTGLIVARPDRDRRYVLRNCEFAVHHVNGGTERRVLQTSTELRATLEDVFLLTLPERSRAVGGAGAADHASGGGGRVDLKPARAGRSRPLRTLGHGRAVVGAGFRPARTRTSACIPRNAP